MECTNNINTYNLYESVKQTVQKFQNAKKIDSLVQENFKSTRDSTNTSQIDQKNYVYLLEDDHTIHREEILKIFGKGGSKTALDIDHGKALLVPYMTGSSTSHVQYNWERMALFEVYMSYKLRCIGLLSPESRLVGLSFSPDVDKHHIPAYLSTSFDYLKNQGCFIIECKGGGGTWEMGKDYLFQSDDDRFNESKWDELVNPLLTDIAKICIYDIALNRDSLNLAIIKQQNSNKYEVRYFGFDFSGKSPYLPKEFSPSEWFLQKIQFAKPKTQFDLENLDDRWRQMRIYSKIKECLPEFIDTLICYEFDKRYGLGAENREEEEKIKAFKQNLIKKYTDDIFNRLKKTELYQIVTE